MDFTIFDHEQHMTALTWLGRRDWMIYQDIPDQRAISARPRKLILKPKHQPEPGLVSPIVVNEKEYNRHPEHMWKTLKEIVGVLDFDVVATLWYNALSKALADGPKIFRPTPLQCEALQHAEARYAFKDYKQPFPVIILEIPEEYREQLKSQYGIDDSPKYVLVNHDDKNQFITVSAFYNKNNIITHITPNRVEYETIEDSLVKNRERRQDSIQKSIQDAKDALSIFENDGEFNAAENVQRLGINFAMMMSLYTVNVEGPLDPKNYKIWQQEATSKRKTGEFTNAALEAQTKLAAALHVIQFDQKVEFFDEIEQHVEIAQGVDIEKLHKSPKSHWRRGHFVMQPCGIGRRERKMIFRKPILIRAKYFLGDVKDASVTYTIHPGRSNLQPPISNEISNRTQTELPPPEPGLQPGQIIRIVQVEDHPMPVGTQGKVLKVGKLGSDIFRIDAITEDGHKFSLISPPDEFEIV